MLKQESFLVLNNSFIVTGPTDDTCVFLGVGLKLHEIQEKLHYTPALPILTEAKIVGRNKIILSDNDLTTVVSRDEFSTLLELLHMENHVVMSGHRSLVFLLQGSRKIVTNYNSLDTNSCLVSYQVLNLYHKTQRLNSKMKTTWNRLKTANLWHGKVVDLAAFGQCIDSPNLEFEDLLLTSRDLLIFCRKGLGEGDSILNLQSSLHNTIKGYNSNFKNMQHFDEQLVNNINNMAKDVEKIAVKENNIVEEFLQIRQDLRHIRKFFSFLILK